MDNNLLAAIVRSIATAASTSGAVITALVLQNKRIDRLETKLDKIDGSPRGADTFDARARSTYVGDRGSNF